MMSTSFSSGIRSAAAFPGGGTISGPVGCADARATPSPLTQANSRGNAMDRRRRVMLFLHVRLFHRGRVALRRAHGQAALENQILRAVDRQTHDAGALVEPAVRREFLGFLLAELLEVDRLVQ